MNSETATHSERSSHAVIANITEQSYTLHRTYGTFRIAGKSEGEEYALTRITPRTAIMDYGDKRTLPLPISALGNCQRFVPRDQFRRGGAQFSGRVCLRGRRSHRGGVARRAREAGRILSRPGGVGGPRVGTLALVCFHP